MMLEINVESDGTEGKKRLAQIREVASTLFNAIDTDGDGSIDRTELKAFYKKLDVSEEWVNALVDSKFKDADENNDDKISSIEYLHLILKSGCNFDGDSVANEEEVEAFLASLDIVQFTVMASNLIIQLNLIEENKIGENVAV